MFCFWHDSVRQAHGQNPERSTSYTWSSGPKLDLAGPQPDVGALIIRIGCWILYYTYNREPPKEYR